MRRCGECRLCCSVFPLPVLDKPAGVWCRLLGPDGCTVHDRGPAARAMIEDFLAAGMAALLLHGPDMRIAYDRTRYPSISPGDIEAAFRLERSRDAEELRRLGAVDENYP